MPTKEQKQLEVLSEDEKSALLKIGRYKRYIILSCIDLCREKGIAHSAVPKMIAATRASLLKYKQQIIDYKAKEADTIPQDTASNAETNQGEDNPA